MERRLFIDWRGAREFEAGAKTGTERNWEMERVSFHRLESFHLNVAPRPPGE